ncbi:MAG: TetR family transcriptional regulator [Burkholderiales bacterium]|nr:TetR family transcriptional regulator [Burkholderiales bacterium]OJX06588.1 MAG: transcriptional regulator [Burkholderiales bacterium 70-64]
MAIAAQTEDNRLLASLALALVDQPRANLQELARAVGVSKATLYRFCRTREQLVERLVAHATRLIGEAIQAAGLDAGPPLEALKRLTANNVEHRELTAFLIYYWKPDSALEACPHIDWEAALDAFFLRGQQEGVFRIDVPAPALTEIWVSILLGLVEAERRGRIARAGLPALVERAFLEGAATRDRAAA